MERFDWLRIRKSVPLVAVLLLTFVVACAQQASSTPAPTPSPTPTAQATKPPAPAATKTLPPVPTKAAEPTKPSSAVPTGPLEVVKVTDVKAMAYPPLYVADARGYFKEQSIAVDFISAAGVADVVAFLATGQLDVAGGSISAGFFNALNRGAQVRIVGPLALEPPVGAGSSAPLIVRKELMDKGEVKSPNDLKGKTVAMNTRSGISEYRLYNVLKQAGLRLADVNIVTLGFPEQLTALQNGAIDAAISTQPFPAQAASMGIAKILVDETIPGQMAFSVQYGAKFIQERTEVAKRFMVATLKGSRDLQNNGVLKPDILDVVSKATGQKPELIQAGVQFTYDPDGKIQVEFVEAQQQFFKEIGKLEYQDLIPTSRLIDDTFVKYAIQQLGTYKK